MGIRQKEACMIWRSGRVSMNDFAYFRKEFLTREGVETALLRVSAHNTAKTYIDGRRVGGYGSPAPTDTRLRKYFNEYEITYLLQSPGAHCLTADAHYLGGSGQNYENGFPGIWVQLMIRYGDSSEQLVVSNTSWSVLSDMPHQSGTPYQQNRRISAIERFDARKWDPAWRLPGWSGSAPTSKARKANTACSDWVLTQQRIPEGQISEWITPTVCTPLKAPDVDGPVQVFDAGRIVSGWPRLKLRGFAGITVRMRYAEGLDAEGRVEHRVCNESSEHYYDEYTMRGDVEEEWEPAFSYKAFRFVEITGYPELIQPGDGIKICFAHTNLQYHGSFRCSDPLLNELYEASIRTQRNNILGQIVDCPHREQAQYLADTDLQAETLIYNFDAVEMLRKTLTDFADAQLDDGTFPFVAPGNYECEEFRIRIPEWDLHFATLLWKLFETSGDVSDLSAFSSPLFRMLDGYIQRIDPNTGLLPKGEGWNISDWPYPTVDDSGQYLTVQQLKLAHALRIASKVSERIERNTGRDDYTRYAASNRTALTELFDPTCGAYRDSSGSQSRHQGVTGYALYANLVPEGFREQALSHIAGCDWESRTVLSLPLLRALWEGGREKEAFAIISRREYPGWGYMITQGSPTLWEGWDDIESHSHAWNGYPARQLQEYVAGIRSESPGFAHAVIRPYIPEELSYAYADVWTPRGKISAGWEKIPGSNKIRCTANIPDGIKARFELRTSDCEICSRILMTGEQEWDVEM